MRRRSRSWSTSALTCRKVYKLSGRSYLPSLNCTVGPERLDTISEERNMYRFDPTVSEQYGHGVLLQGREE
jgi:hypothetical protein